MQLDSIIENDAINLSRKALQSKYAFNLLSIFSKHCSVGHNSKIYQAFHLASNQAFGPCWPSALSKTVAVLGLSNHNEIQS